MNLKYLKDKPAVQFAIGLTAILIMATWFLTGDLPFVSSVMFQKPEADVDGNVKALPPLGPIAASMAFQAVCWVGASLIGLMSGLYSMIVGGLNKPTAVAAPTTGTVDIADASYGLCQGAQENDPEKMEVNRVALRLPRAIQLQSDAISRGDIDSAEVYMAEIRTLLNQPSQKVAVRKAAKQ